jgi:hypothetical protein
VQLHTPVSSIVECYKADALKKRFWIKLVFEVPWLLNNGTSLLTRLPKQTLSPRAIVIFSANCKNYKQLILTKHFKLEF